MKTIPVEQISMMPMLAVYEFLTVLILFTVGILLVNKFMKKNNRKKLIASSLVGILTAVAMIGVFFVMTNYVASTNHSNLRSAVTASGEKLNDQQIGDLEREGVVTIDDNKTIAFSDEGNGYNLTVLDSTANQKAQTEQEKKQQQQMKDNNY